MLAEVAGIDAKRSYTMNILHITDLHFGTDRSITERDERHSALEELIVTRRNWTRVGYPQWSVYLAIWHSPGGPRATRNSVTGSNAS
jgi:hypothetical protein